MSPFTPYLAAGALLACVVTGASSFFFGRHLGVLETEASYAKADAADAREQAKRLQTAQVNDDKGAGIETIRTNTVREITREAPKIIAGSTVYRNVCTDADGVRALSRSVEAANGRVPAGGGFADGPTGVRPPASEAGPGNRPSGARR